MGGISDCGRAVAGSPSRSFRDRVGRSTEVSAMPQPMQLAQIVAKPPCGQCSTVTEDSKQTRCCKVTGYGCFYTNKAAVVAECMKKCTQ